MDKRTHGDAPGNIEERQDGVLSQCGSGFVHDLIATGVPSANRRYLLSVDQFATFGGVTCCYANQTCEPRFLNHSLASEARCIEPERAGLRPPATLSLMKFIYSLTCNSVAWRRDHFDVACMIGVEMRGVFRS